VRLTLVNIAEVNYMGHIVDCAHGKSAVCVQREALFDINCLNPVTRGNVEDIYVCVAVY